MIDKNDPRYKAFADVMVNSEDWLGDLTALDLTNGLLRLIGIQVAAEQELAPEMLDYDPMLVRSTALALMTEVGELADAMGTKPWKPVDEGRERILDEAADVMAFFALMMLHVMQKTNVHESELADAFILKVGKNIMRSRGQSGEPGYGGVGVIEPTTGLVVNGHGPVTVINAPAPEDQEPPAPNVWTFRGFCEQHDAEHGEGGPHAGPHHHKDCSWWAEASGPGISLRDRVPWQEEFYGIPPEEKP